MTGLPDGWMLESLSAVASWGSGGTPQAGNAAFYGGDIPWAVIGDLNEATVMETRASITDAGLAASSAKLVPEGAVLLAMYGSIGKLGIAGRPMATNQAIAFALPHDRVLGKYLFYYLLSQRHQLDAAGKGAAQRNISQTILRPWPIPFPEGLDEQQRIVDILEDHLSRLTEAEALLEKNRCRLATYRRAVVDSVFWHSDSIGKNEGERLVQNLARSRESRWSQSSSGKRIKAPVVADLEIFNSPHPWPVVSLESATDPRRTIRYGILKPGIGQGGTVRYVEVRDLAGNTLSDKTFRLTSRQLDEQFSGSRLAGGDVVIAVRGSYERTAVVPKELDGANLSRDVARLAPLPELMPELLHHWLQTSSSKAYLNRHARGVAVKGVNISTLRAMPVPLLPMELQLRIVDTVNAQLSAGDRATLEIDRATRRSETLRKSLLAAAFSGRLNGRSTDIEIIEEMAGV
jgi:type I restriction enzyme S subunit